MHPSTGIDALQRARAHWNDHDLNGYLALYHPDAVLHGYPGVGPGSAAIRGFYEAFWAAFPRSTLQIDDLFAAGDKVTCRFVVRGRHDGPFQGLPASGRPFELPGITILRFDADGRCVERWSQADFLALLQQIGALPAPR